MNAEFSLSAIDIVTPDNVQDNSSIRIKEGKIVDFSRSKIKDFEMGGGYTLFPGIINPHDHLFGTYHPKIGQGTYVCWLPWDYDLKASEIYKERNKNTALDIYLLGAYKNLISGVTIVHDHIPHKVNEPHVDRLPIRVLTKYALSHECSAYDLNWGDGIDIEYKRAVNNNMPYVTHIEEGWDTESLRGIDILLEHKALSEYTVLIHGIGFSDEDIQQVAKKKANFIWCPGSNMFMFDKTAKVKQILEAGINTSIGTDSPATGELNILEEIRFGKETYRKMYNEELPDAQIVKMITVNPARAFRVSDKLGSIEKGKLGDLLLIRGAQKKRAHSLLVNARLKDIALVFLGGKPIYGDNDFDEIFKELGSDFSRLKIEGKDKLITGDPNSLMERIRKTVGFHKELPFLPI
jgi:5-methylthioadenosine/S-adenosylhomocysteine deaminase